MDANALKNLNDEPAFGAIKPAQIKPALSDALANARATIEQIKSQQIASWANTITPLTDANEQVGRIWGVVGHLQSVLNTPELRDAYNKMLPEITQFFTEIGQDVILFERFKAIKQSPIEYDYLNNAQKQKLEHDLRDFTLCGANLPKDTQQRFAEVQIALAELSAKFSENVLDATDAFALYIEDVTELKGLPEDALNMFAAAAKIENKTGYKIGLQSPHYLAIMQYAENQELRAKLYRAYVTRASDLGEAKFDNTDIITKRLQLAQEEANLLGFNNYAELSLATKMADTVDDVITFLENLATKARPFAQKDKVQLQEFAQKQLNLTDLQAWDLAFVSEKLRQEKYTFSEQEVKKFFPANRVISGLFELIHTLYGITFTTKTVPIWHPDVHYFELHQQDKTIGGVYMDLYARENKRGGAWMNDYRGRRALSDHIQTPIAYLTCNFTPALDGKEAYLNHDEILTLFHEMGHGLHHLLTQVDELGVAGINGVEWDAVELPSQFMENFAWEYAVLAKMSEQESSKEKLPETLFNKMLAAKNFQSGMQTLRQVEFALFDLLLYQNTHNQPNWQAVLEQVRQQVSVFKTPEFNRFAQSFGHIFAGGYAAGYYSYKWAEVLSCDAYAAFEENPNKGEMGQKFWQEILAVGGSRPAMESFVAFRGRKPTIDALLRLNGMSN